MSDQGIYKVPLAVGTGPSIGLPICFARGPFRGRVVRTTAAEIQKADAGRKFARKDKRPLDPPPVVQVRFFEVFNLGTVQQYEAEITEYDEILSVSLLCQADLFPILGEDIVLVPPRSFVSGAFSGYGSSSGKREREPSTTIQYNAQVPGSDTVIAYYGGYGITEATNSTDILAGARVATAVISEHKGRPILAFPFTDLAVKQEGSYTLRYRIFDIFSRTLAADGMSEFIPIIAHCFGGEFKVWSSKTFPGLAASTALTKRLSLHGMPVHVRETERRGRRKKPRYQHKDPQGEGSASPQSQPSDTTMSQGHAGSSISPERRVAPNLRSDWAGPSRGSGSAARG